MSEQENEQATTIKPKEYDQKIEELQTQKREAYLQQERNKLSNLKCKKCNTPLKGRRKTYKAIDRDVKIDELLQFRSKPFKIECSKCQRLNIISVTFKDIPYPQTEVKIDISGSVWDELPVIDLTQEQITKGLEDELDKIKNNRSDILQLPNPIQRDRKSVV